LRGVDLNHRPLGYEISKVCNFKDLHITSRTDQEHRNRKSNVEEAQILPQTSLEILRSEACGDVDIGVYRLAAGRSLCLGIRKQIFDLFTFRLGYPVPMVRNSKELAGIEGSPRELPR
jgi:hypothetical protein